MERTLLILVIWIAGAFGLYWLFARRANARLARERMTSTIGEDTADPKVVRDTYLTRWLTSAGFRALGSSSAFVLATVLGTVIGLLLGLLLAFSGILDALMENIGGVSEAMDSMLLTAFAILPWAVAVVCAITPWLYVRAKRRDRVEAIERELPIVLELLATLSESGLGFDASFSKILDAEREETPLIEEFRIFRNETLSGIPRIRCFRRLSQRCEISSMTIFCSALIQAEQIGTGFSAVLRTQANDLRGRRRDRAMIRAQALPVKLVFPLVICFLPGIFVVTLGPAFKEFFDLAQGVLTGNR